MVSAASGDPAVAYVGPLSKQSVGKSVSTSVVPMSHVSEMHLCASPIAYPNRLFSAMMSLGGK